MNYPDKFTIADRLYQAILTGDKYVFISLINNKDYKRKYFKIFSHKKWEEPYILNDYLKSLTLI
jgi:hypothetical protein